MDPFFKTFANQPPVFAISFHLREIPLWSLDWDLPLSFLNPVYEPKSTVHLLTLAFTITNQKSNCQVPTIALRTSLPLHLCYVCCLCWLLLFLCTISLAFHLLFGLRAASLLLSWLIDWLIEVPWVISLYDPRHAWNVGRCLRYTYVDTKLILTVYGYTCPYQKMCLLGVLMATYILRGSTPSQKTPKGGGGVVTG